MSRRGFFSCIFNVLTIIKPISWCWRTPGLLCICECCFTYHSLQYYVQQIFAFNTPSSSTVIVSQNQQGLVWGGGSSPISTRGADYASTSRQLLRYLRDKAVILCDSVGRQQDVIVRRQATCRQTRYSKLPQDYKRTDVTHSPTTMINSTTVI